MSRVLAVSLYFLDKACSFFDVCLGPISCFRKLDKLEPVLSYWALLE